MKGRLAGIAALAAGFAIAGCNDSTDPATGPDYARGRGGLVCDFQAMKTDATTFFTLNSTRLAAAQGSIAFMKSNFGSSGNAAVTSAGFDVLSAIADEHREPAGSAGAKPLQGSALANDVIGCMTTVSPLPTATTDFALAYDSSGTTAYRGALSRFGAFEVRGGPNDANTTAILSVNTKSGIQAPGNDFTTWLPASNPRLLFYAMPIGNGFLVADAKVGAVGYRWLTFPEQHTFTGFATTGVCVNATDRDRLQEVGTTTKMLALASIDGLGLSCAAGPAVLADAGTTGIWSRALHLAAKAFLPEEAYAGKLGGGTGGLLGGLSDIGVVDVGAVKLTVARIKDATTTTDFTVTVTVKTAGGLALPGEHVKVTVAGNNGSFTLTGAQDVVTNSSGQAVFTLRLDKPGGYTLTATDDYGATDNVGSVPATAVSGMFHIKQ